MNDESVSNRIKKLAGEREAFDSTEALTKDNSGVSKPQHAQSESSNTNR